MIEVMQNDDLVFDIGFHTGEDTAFYLELGYRVVAFEANPNLIEQGKIRFSDAISKGKLTIIEGAICGKRGGPKFIKFYQNSANAEWGTVSPDFAQRNVISYKAKSLEILVPLIPIQEVIECFGLPNYAKIDVEGIDLEILSAFSEFSRRPEYISIESEASNFNDLMVEMETLRELGYKSFQVVQQRSIPGRTFDSVGLFGQPVTFTFPRSSSGSFGNDLVGKWLSYDETIERHQQLFKCYRKWGPDSILNRLVGRKPIAALQFLIRRPLPGWYDTHARLSAP